MEQEGLGVFGALQVGGVQGARKQGQDMRPEMSTGRAWVMKNLVPMFISWERIPQTAESY